MATNQLARVVRTINEAALQRGDAGSTDGQLLESYLRGREEAAFAALVHRHGAMVWGVCRRVLRNHQDAEDAFQATFLVLVRKAASIMSKELVANWLYGVAHQTALKARATTAKRGTREQQMAAMPEPAAPHQPVWNEVQPLLDQELSRLPDKYRAVIVLSDLEGKTRKEVAQQLKLHDGTVASRLATARAMLAKRLARRGVVLSGGALAAVLAQNAASARVPLPVASITIKAASLFAAGQATVAGGISLTAVALAEGVLKTMLWTKLKMVCAVLAVAILSAGAAALMQQAGASRERERPEQNPAPAAKPADQTVAKAEPAVKEKKEAAALPTAVRGVVKAVDTQQNTLTVTYGTGQGTFAVPANATVNIDGKLGKLSGLPPGANVTLSQFADATTVRTIQATGRWYFGASVKGVDAERNTITIGDRDGDKTFAVAPAAFITIDGKSSKLAALPTGAFVNVGLAVDQVTVCSIGAEGPHLGGCGGSMVKAVDAENSTITFDDKAAPEVSGKTFTVGQGANIVIDGRAGKLAELSAGCYLNVTLTVDQKTVGSVHAQGPPVQCDCGGSCVKAVDLVNHTITFDDKARAEVAGKTFPVAKNANIIIDGRSGTLAELPVGAFVALGLRVDQKTAGILHAQGRGVSGVLKAVDVANHTVTVDETIYTVARDALIVIDGKQGPLVYLQTGVGVNLTLRVDQQTVGMIQTKAP
jgi:RNA polymerase sigma factor (sigma-70 family)